MATREAICEGPVKQSLSEKGYGLYNLRDEYKDGSFRLTCSYCGGETYCCGDRVDKEVAVRKHCSEHDHWDYKSAVTACARNQEARWRERGVQDWTPAEIALRDEATQAFESGLFFDWHLIPITGRQGKCKADL